MSSPLTRVPIARRRRLAATLGLFAVLFVAIGAVAATGATTAWLTAFVAIAFVVAVLLGLLAWGVANSIRLDRATTTEASLDAAIEAAVRARGEQMCDCGHEHDPTELHVPDDPCARDGHGTGCTHSCESCVFATMSRAAARPSPGPKRPSPVRR